MNKPKAETFFLVTDKGKVTEYGEDILGAVHQLKKTPKGAVIRSDGILMAGDPRAIQTAEAGEFQPMPWGKLTKMRYTEEEEAPPPKKKSSSRPPDSHAN
jgi:hypothetical protein